jgi:hypothetical protein
MISAKVLSGAKMLRWSAALLLVGGPLLGLLFGSLGMAVLAFGFGAVHLVHDQARFSAMDRCS